MSSFLANISSVIQHNPWFALGAAFLGGIVSTFSPCVLAMVPLTVGFIGGYAAGSTRRAVLFSLVFVVGLSATFTALGAVAAFVGGLFGQVSRVFYYVIAAVAVVLGLNLVGVLRFEWPALERIKVKRAGLLGALLAGLAFGIVASPCATPVLAAVLAFAAATRKAVYGMALLLAYALGHWALVLAAGISTAFVERLIVSRGATRAGRIFRISFGIVLIGAGLYILWCALRGAI